MHNATRPAEMPPLGKALRERVFQPLADALNSRRMQPRDFDALLMQNPALLRCTDKTFARNAFKAYLRMALSDFLSSSGVLASEPSWGTAWPSICKADVRIDGFIVPLIFENKMLRTCSGLEVFCAITMDNVEDSPLHILSPDGTAFHISVDRREDLLKMAKMRPESRGELYSRKERIDGELFYPLSKYLAGHQDVRPFRDRLEWEYFSRLNPRSSHTMDLGYVKGFVFELFTSLLIEEYAGMNPYHLELNCGRGGCFPDGLVYFGKDGKLVFTQDPAGEPIFWTTEIDLLLMRHDGNVRTPVIFEMKASENEGYSKRRHQFRRMVELRMDLVRKLYWEAPYFCIVNCGAAPGFTIHQNGWRRIIVPENRQLQEFTLELWHSSTLNADVKRVSFP